MLDKIRYIDAQDLLSLPSNSPLLHKMASSSSSLPPSVFNPRRHVGVNLERVTDVTNTEYPGHYPDEDHSWDLAKFKQVGNVNRLAWRTLTRRSQE